MAARAPKLAVPLSPARVGLVAAVAIGGAVAASVLGLRGTAPVERWLTVEAYQYAYAPERIEVNRGDVVHLKLWSRDVIHGFFLEGHDLNAEIYPHRKDFKVEHPDSGRPEERVEEITFVAGAPGKYRYRCSHTCGTLHPFMNGEMIVHPNTPLHAGVGGTLGLFAGLVLALWGPFRSARGRTAPHGSGGGGTSA